MKKINFCKATTIILIINVILSIVLFFVVPDNIAIQWVGTTPSNAVDSYYIFLVPILSVLFALVNPKPYGISEYQVNTPFSQELMEELQQIPEVKEIYATERTAAIIEYHDEQLEIPIIPITPDNQEEI